ncbi:hypothetical protein ACA910_006177 [Epithemia clementina (nom. ined.)]
MITDELIGAISSGDFNRLEKLVRKLDGKPCSLDASDSLGMTPLAKASQRGNLKIVQFLLKEGAQADGIPPGNNTSSSSSSSIGGTGAGSSNGGNFRSPLVAATAAGHVRVVEQLLGCGAHVDATHMYQMTCLHIACNKGWHKVVAALLDHGANINAQDKRGWTPLYHAAQRGHLSCVQLLLSSVAAVALDKTSTNAKAKATSSPVSPENDKNKDNRVSSLSSSSSSMQSSPKSPPPSSSSTTRSLQIGTPVWVRRKGQPASQLLEGEVAYLGPVRFAKSQNWVGVRLTGPSSQGQGKNNGTVQGITYFYTDAPYSGLFVRRSAITFRRRQQSSDQTPAFKCCQVNIPSFHRLSTPLHAACQRGRLPVVRYLIEHGNANLHACDQTGWTPFFSACYEGDLEVVMYLAQHYFSNVDSVKNNFQETPLWVACLAGNLPVVDFLIAKGANVNTSNAKGVSPFFMACAQGRLEMVTSLLERGADPNAPNHEGLTPLGWACLRGRMKLAQCLVQQHCCSPDKCGGVHLEAGYQGNSCIMTPLWIASKQGNLDLVRLLALAGANLEALDPQTGLIPLAVAALNGHKEVVQFLVLYGSQQQQPHLCPRISHYQQANPSERWQSLEQSIQQ